MKIGMLTGGGDCPGLNPAIRGAVLRLLDYGDEVIGFTQGWKGLVEGNTEPLTLERVEGIIDQGGTIEGIHETTHSDPVFVRHDVLHYAVGNVPGAVPNTSTYALTNATLPYAVELAIGGIDAVHGDPALAGGVNTLDGAVTNAAVAHALDLPLAPMKR